jgi:hypothetical protein
MLKKKKKIIIKKKKEREEEEEVNTSTVNKVRALAADSQLFFLCLGNKTTF